MSIKDVERIGILTSGVFLLVCVLLLGCGSVLGRVTASGALSGTVSDQKGAIIPGATVTVTNKATGATRTTTTNGDGEFKLDLLPAGRYDIKVSASGFGDVTSERVELLVGQTNTLSFTMTPGLQTASVTVTAGEAELVSREKTDISVNRVDNKDNTVGGPVMQFPLEAIQEFIISTQRFSAVNGRSEGAAVNVVTKSGGTGYHGSVFYFLRDKKLNATEVDPSSQQKLAQKPPFNRKIWGGSIGGPLVLPRFGEGGPSITGNHQTYFFFALERQNEATSIPVPADAVAELQRVQFLGAQPASIIPTPYRDWRINARIDHRFNANNSIFATFNSQSNIGLNDQFASVGGRADLTAGNFTKNKLLLGNITLNSVLSNSVVNAVTVGYQYWNNLIDTDLKVPTFTFPTGITFGTNTNVPQQSYQAKYQIKDDLSISRGKHTYRAGLDYLWEPKLGGFFEFNPTLEIDFTTLPSAINALPAKFATAGLVGGMTATAGNPYFNLQGGAKMFGVYFQDDW